MSQDAVIQVVQPRAPLEDESSNPHAPLAEEAPKPLTPGNADATVYEQKGLEHLRAGRFKEGIEQLELALKINPNNPVSYLNMGVAYKELGDFETALSLNKKALQLVPDYADAYNNVGIIFLSLKKMDDAVASLKKALAIKPDYLLALYNLGNVYTSTKEFGKAIECYKQALSVKPDYMSAALNLGNVLRDDGKIQEAILCYEQALSMSENHEVLNNLGNVLSKQGRCDEAISCFKRALAVKPDYFEGHNNLGNVFAELGQIENAEQCFGRAIEFNPEFAEAYLNLGNMAKERCDWQAAISYIEKSLELRPDFAAAHSSLGLVLAAQGKMAESIVFFNHWLESQGAMLSASPAAHRLGSLLIELERLPVIYQDADEVVKAREHFSECLEKAYRLAEEEQESFTESDRTLLRQILFRVTNFYLVYQQGNDCQLQCLYANLMAKILKPDLAQFQVVERSRNPGSKIRVGIASQRLKYHNGCSWVYGWLFNLPQQDYEFFLYSLNGKTDGFTEKLAEFGTYRWLPFRQHNYTGSLEVIRQDKLDVLLLPDVGMLASSKIIALARLAPVQCVGWGHPVTTGSPNMDYYLIGELMETADSDSHYSEQLVRLPDTGVCFDNIDPPAGSISREEFGIEGDRIVYGAVQSLFKYLPQFDCVFPDIARKVPNSLIVFVGSESDFVTAEFTKRLKKCFDEAGVPFDKHVKIYPRMDLERFMRLLCVTDVYLDSIGFSGGMTAMRSLAVDCPVVTLPNELMCGRLAYAMLKMIGVDELIAGSLDNYVSLAARLGKNEKLRLSMIKRIKDNKHKLFNDKKCVEYLDQFFKAKVAMSKNQT